MDLTKVIITIFVIIETCRLNLDNKINSLINIKTYGPKQGYNFGNYYQIVKTYSGLTTIR